MTQEVIKIEDVCKTFGEGTGQVTALNHVDLSVREGEFTVLIGPSGCGKSTLLYLVAGFEKPTEGVILLYGKPITKPGPDRGFVFQDYALFPWLTVLGNVMYGLRQNGLSRGEAKQRAMKFIEMVHLSGFEHAYPHTLSGGMKQRVGIARALAYEPKVLLMDEPFGSLDAQTRKLMHSVIEAVYLADRIIVLTARPGTVKGIVDISIPRPREYTEEHYLEFRRMVLNLLEEEVTKEMELGSAKQLP